MPTSPTRRWIAGLALLAAILFAAFLWLRPLLSVGTGYAAKHACSCHFLQGRELDEISENDLNFSVLGWMGLNEGKQSVRANFLGLVHREAFYLPGRGCVLMMDEGRDMPEASGPPQTAATTSVVTADNDRLIEALDFGMQAVPGGGARGIVVMRKGKIVGERYAESYGPETPMLGWSMTKSLTGLLLGSFVDLAPASAPRETKNLFPEEWTDLRAEISLDDLMNMNSGLAWNEGYGSLTDATVMLHEAPDMADYAMKSPLTEPPGTKWAYSSGTTNILMEYASRKAGGNEALYTEMERLFDRVAPSLIIEPDQSGRPVGSSYGWATTRDWARLGQLMLQKGVWESDTLVPPEWIVYMQRPAEDSNGDYGAQLWLRNGGGYAMRGFQDQRVIVLPNLDVVIARLGHNDDDAADIDGLVEKVRAAYE